MKRILITDRDAAHAAHVSDALSYLGFRTLVCHSTEHAIAAAGLFRPHTVIAALAHQLDESIRVAAALREAPATADARLICICDEPMPASGAPRASCFDHRLARAAPLYDLVRLIV